MLNKKLGNGWQWHVFTLTCFTICVNYVSIHAIKGKYTLGLSYFTEWAQDNSPLWNRTSGGQGCHLTAIWYTSDEDSHGVVRRCKFQVLCNMQTFLYSADDKQYYNKVCVSCWKILSCFCSGSPHVTPAITWKPFHCATAHLSAQNLCFIIPIFFTNLFSLSSFFLGGPILSQCYANNHASNMKCFFWVANK